jgi:hypothetical protein
VSACSTGSATRTSVKGWKSAGWSASDTGTPVPTYGFQSGSVPARSARWTKAAHGAK